MRARGFLALGLFLALTAPALAARTAVNCIFDPNDSLTRNLNGAGSGTIYIKTTEATGVLVTITTVGTATVTLDSAPLFTVIAGTRSSQITEVFSDAYGAVRLTTTDRTTMTVACNANPPDTQPISEMQALSPFEQQNLVSSSAAFHALDDDTALTGAGTTDPLAFSPDQVRATEALKAIDGTFALLGYGPNGGLAGDALIARGEDWLVKGIVRASISQGDVSGGTLTETDGRASLLLQGRLPGDQRYAVSVTGGLGKADAPGQSDRSRRLRVDGAYALPLTDAVDLILGANWGAAAHDVDLGSATGNYAEQMTSASFALRGEQDFGGLTLAPLLTGNIGYEWLPDFTDSAATAHAGGQALLASIEAGARLSWRIDTGAGPSISPFFGATLSAYHQSYAENGGATTTSDGIGGELTLGIREELGGNAEAGLTGTLGRHGSTGAASISGSLSGRF